MLAAARPRERLILLVGLLLGLRVSEIVNLQVPDLDLDAGQAMIREAKGQRDRAVPIPPGLADELRAWLRGRKTGYLFPGQDGQPISTRTVQRWIKRVALKAGIADAEAARKVTPHRMRHTYATTLLRTGADITEVKELLGHSFISTTMIYLSADATRMREAARRVEEALGD